MQMKQIKRKIWGSVPLLCTFWRYLDNFPQPDSAKSKSPVVVTNGSFSAKWQEQKCQRYKISIQTQQPQRSHAATSKVSQLDNREILKEKSFSVVFVASLQMWCVHFLQTGLRDSMTLDAHMEKVYTTPVKHPVPSTVLSFFTMDLKTWTKLPMHFAAPWVLLFS